MMRCFPLCLLTSLLSVTLSLPVQAQSTEEDVFVQAEGMLEPGDETFSDGSLYDAYPFEGQAGQAIVITLGSEAFDAYLWLTDGNGNLLAENDDWNNGTNAMIGYVLPANGSYWVLASANDPAEQGAYIGGILLTESDNPIVLESEADRLNQQGIGLYNLSQYSEALTLFEQSLAIRQEIDDRSGVGESLNNIGNIYDNLGEYAKALDFYEQSLAIHQELGNRSGVGEPLNNIGGIYSSLGEYPKALEFYEQSLTISQEIGDRDGEGITLSNIGSIYDKLGEYAKALEFYEQSLAIHREIENRSGEGTSLNNIGGIYSSLGDYSKALEFYEQSLIISQEIGDRDSESAALNNIGGIYDDLGEYVKALKFYEQSLSIHKEIGNRNGEATNLNNIGGIYKSLGDYSKALDFHGQSLAIYKEIGDRNGEGTSLNNIGGIYKSLGDYSEALKFYEQSLVISQEIGDHSGESIVFNNIGNIYGSLGDYPKALDFYEQSLAIQKEIGDRSGESTSLGNIGFVYSHLGDYSEALDFYEQSLVISQEIGDRSGESATLGNIGVVYAYLEDYPKALEFYEQSLVISQEIGDRQGEVTTLNNIGSVYDSLGEYAKALDFYEQSLVINKEICDRSGEGKTLNNIGFVYDDLGAYAEALDFYAQSLAISQEIGDRSGEGVTLNNIGVIHSRLEEYPKALEFYEQSLVIRQEIGDRSGESATLGNMGFVHSRLEEYPKALEFYRQSLTISQKIADRSSEGATLSNIGVVYFRLEEYSKALEFYRQSLTISQEIGDRSSEGVTLNNIGYVLESLNYPVLAIVYFKQSVNVYETIRTDIQALSNEQQQSFTETIAHSYRKLADLLLQQDRVLEAQRVLDLLKVQELDDYLHGVRSETITELGVDLLPQESEFWVNTDSILAQAVPIATELQSLRQIPFPDRSATQNERILALEAAQTQILDQFIAFIESEEIQQLIAQLSRTAQAQDVLTELNQFPTLQDNLVDIGNAVLLYPLILEDRLELVLVTPDGPPTSHPIPVPRDELTQAISEFQQALRDKNSNPEPLAQQLYQWLIAPLEPALAATEAETIIYAPDGPLRYIPLAALHDGSQWLAQRYEVNHITAASLTDLNLRPSRDPVVLAGAFSQGNHSISAGDRTLEFKGLPYAGVEVELLQDAFPTTPFFDDEFSRSSTEPLFNDHSIVHLATHAALLIGSPLDSFILFGNGDQLTLAELKGWRGRLRSVDLVVLSACETGTGSIKDSNGEEILGFGYLMQDAGARAVISSLWPVSDGGTQELMTNFYEVLKVEGMTKADALQQAQIALITGNQIDAGSGERFEYVPRNPDAPDALPTSRLSHPYYWAPFILIGNGL